MEKEYRIAGNKLLAYMLDNKAHTFSEKKSSFHQNWQLAMQAVEFIEHENVGSMSVIIDRTLVTIKGEYYDGNWISHEYYWYGGWTSEPKILCLFYGLVEFAKVYCQKQL